jgi:DNA polymerase-4
VVLAEAGPLIEARGITLLGISIANLDDDGSVQLELPFDRSALTSLDLALDDVKERFGSSAVTRAVHLGKDLGWSVPMLPD